jgi:hypothetical protein
LGYHDENHHEQQVRHLKTAKLKWDLNWSHFFG